MQKTFVPHQLSVQYITLINQNEVLWYRAIVYSLDLCYVRLKFLVTFNQFFCFNMTSRRYNMEVQADLSE